MFTVLRKLTNIQNLGIIIKKRTFLSHAYYCNEVWEQRLQDPLIQKMNLDELYNELDQRYQKTKNISPVDVDIFAHAAKDDSYSDELLDLIHKLRMSAESSNTLNSTSHAVVRYLMNYEKTDQLLTVLDDRLNYGIFLEDFTANLLMDTFWKKKDFASGVRVASQLMLQEEFKHPISTRLSLLLCYKYLLNPGKWPQPLKPVESEEVKIRINYLRNPYNDEHFDLHDPFRIVGKTLMYITKNSLQDALDRSLHLVGLSLFKPELAKNLVNELKEKQVEIYSEVLKLLPGDNPIHLEIDNLKSINHDVEEALANNVKLSICANSERDISLQCQTYSKWNDERKEALEKQRIRLQTMQRLSNVEKSKKKLKEKEMLLWFFENEEQIELEIESKKAREGEQLQNTNISSMDTDESYIPPEVHKQHVP